MVIKVSEELTELAKLFNKNGENLYIVGGFVRDAILGLKSTQKNDIDLCSACRPDKLVKILKDSNFTYEDRDVKYGTIIINGKNRYEHTTFRTENYNLNGEHNPTGVEFVKDINLDARRRDFTINAIYYDILKEEIIDPVLGTEDLKNGIIKTPDNSNKSLKEDSERILRLIRFASTFNFLIDEKVAISAMKLASGVKNLSKHRIKKEFEKMLLCDQFYPDRKESKYAHAKCLILVGKFDLWQYILPIVDKIQKSELKDNKAQNLYLHIINCVAMCEPDARLACLLHDAGKAYTKLNGKNFNFSKDWTKVIIEKELGIDGLLYSKNQIAEIVNVVNALDFDKYGFAKKSTVKKYIANNFGYFDKICKVKDCIALENTNFTQKSKIAKRWRNIYNSMIQSKTPISVQELDIGGDDILDVIKDINHKHIGELLQKLLDMCIVRPELNVKHLLIEKVKKIVLKSPSLYLEN